ncbi:LuxR C-terminal-related transcriptional regulator [Acaryochloris thomasi]|nr:LuxR C-terminal-related transcriptional regulator [Acaryochloris thomasi]
MSAAPSEGELRSHVIPKCGEHFATQRQGLFFFDRLPLMDRKFQSLKQAFSIEHNPVVRYLVERHAPVHEGLVTSPKVWQVICPRPDHWHVMAGPVVNQGQLVGAIGFTRERTRPSFDDQDLADLSAICLHLSAWVATVRPQRQAVAQQRLTPRELEIAELVATGRTNAAIGRELWITENSVKQALKRMFRKLQVTSRAELVTQLYVSKNDISGLTT